jgi:ABC-type transport system involved in multi-copper enzyme maturation permease subunit
MLAYKAWRETRARFAVALAVISGLALVFIAAEATFRTRMIAVGGPHTTYQRFVELRIFTGVVHAAYLVLAVVLGLGGFVRERVHGTLGFTLALPVPRSHHAIARAGLGLAEVFVLALVPALLVPLCSPLIGETYGWSTAMAFVPSWLALGALVFALALVISIIVHNDYAALAIAVVALRLAARVAVPAPAAVAIAAVAIAGAALVLDRQRYSS